jgi:hypothetical protein
MVSRLLNLLKLWLWRAQTVTGDVFGNFGERELEFRGGTLLRDLAWEVVN